MKTGRKRLQRGGYGEIWNTRQNSGSALTGTLATIPNVMRRGVIFYLLRELQVGVMNLNEISS